MTEFPEAMRLARSSVLWRWSGRAQVVLVQAAQSSAVGAALRRATESTTTLAPAERLQLGATVIGIAACVQGVVLAIAPATVMPALPVLWLVAALMAVTTAASAWSLVKAWPSSRCHAAVMATRARLKALSSGR